jgi:hypothetical protein
MRIIYTIENTVNDQSLALLAFSLGFRHSAESKKLDLLPRSQRLLFGRGEWVQALPLVKYQWMEQVSRRSEREVPSES